ncbi:PREDICTED: RING finger protein 10 isoform X1 [Acromyrmex echinatior]|uniref:E3 ubiquitin-protein ligase RNF10 n=2 Tax=Acromyrmex echinatior TaxID=103372 RepID=F4W667_ACREC|nr:PREDICTED: RING finger protein 10 isoform X1 [Acromyrmex echinatior]EGI70202.1 RING finger protein 10 [Acromyrmex echinatior]
MEETAAATRRVTRLTTVNSQMDIKSKFTLSPARGTTADARKNKDVNNEFHLGTLRRRELTGANNVPDDVQSTRYNVQKAKDLIKRQRPKGQYHGSAEENSKVVEEKMPEYGSVLVQRSKKNGNHLLNFHYERYVMRDAQNRDVGRHNSNSNRLLPPVQRHKYNKEQFVQASCQFVVTASRDYSLHLTNPDILVDWKSIEQIILHNSENLSCPICLHPPVAGKMTRCGHVYCWPCILRYLRYCQETGNYKCPICDEYLHKNDLKSVVEITRRLFNLGETINLCLMRREKNSLFTTPVKSTVRPPTTFLSVSENADNQIYSKLLIANVNDIVNIIECENSELELELKINPAMAPDINQALSELSKRKEKLLWQIAESKDAPLTENIMEKEIAEETLQKYEIDVDTCKDDDKSLAKQSSTDSVSSDSQTASSPSKFSYFYQAEDGQHLYLHAANVKMLEMEYGSLEYCPPIITGKLLEKEASIYTEELRRRLRYLCHLPLTCPFELAEIELKPPLVSEKVLCAFHDQLNSRQKYREQREREERKREKKIIEEENRQIGIYPTPDIDIESYQHFPQLQSELQLSNENVLSPSESVMSSIASSPPALSAFEEIAPKQETDHSREQTRTFADITKRISTMPTKMSNKSANAWPVVRSKTYSDTTNACFNRDEEVLSKTHKSTNAWPPVKSGIFAGTPGTSINEDGKKTYVSEETKDENNAFGKKKRTKKKGKGTVLFTTGMTSGYSL